MSSPFDRHRAAMYNIIDKQFAVPVIWVSLDELSGFTGLVLFNDPTIKEMVDGSGFIPETAYIEFTDPAFSGLKIRVDSQSKEVVSIDGTDYYVKAVERTFDGKNNKAYVQLVTDTYGPQ